MSHFWAKAFTFSFHTRKSIAVSCHLKCILIINKFFRVADDNRKSNKNSYLNSNYDKKHKENKSSNKTLTSSSNESEETKVHIKAEDSYGASKSKSNIKKNRIKLEPESDIDLPKKKKKYKEIEINQNDSKDCVSYDETYLHMKVKQEEYSKHEIESRKSKKKKNKSSIEYHSDEHNLEIEDKMDIGETVVNKPERNNEILHKNNHITPNSENNTFQEEYSEGSGCDEISAIKCDNDHNLHTISFDNKITGEEVIKKYNFGDNLNLSKIKASEQKSTENCESLNPRKPRISDRIQFEDEEDTNIESSQVHENDKGSSKKSSKVKHFTKANPNLKLLTQHFENNSCLTLDDEIWMLKCPKEVDIKQFDNTSLKIHEKCKIKVSGQTYDGSAEEQLDTIALLTMEHTKHKICNLPLSGIINLRKRIPKAHFRNDNIMVNNQTNFIPLPETKCRHPLFGSNYKKALKIPAAIAERLNEQDNEEISMKTEKRKKKKNRKDRNTSEQVDSQIQSELIMKTEGDLSMEVTEKKKKKRKLTANEGPAPKKVKRIKHDPESAEAWESEKAIEENLFNF